MPTHHEKIMISKDIVRDFNLIDKNINEIIEAALRYKSSEVVARLKKLVPEYISKNSEFESLDPDEIITIKEPILKKVGSHDK